MPRATTLQPTIRVFCTLAAILIARDFTRAQSTATPPAQSKHRDAWRQNASVSRFYTFENLRAEAPVPNMAEVESAPLQFGTALVAGAAPETWQVVNGRWTGKKAVRLDQGFLWGAAPKVSERAFSAALWFRKRGQGAHRGNSDSSNGTLVSCGSGYYDGWRVTTEYPARTVAFEIGRPQGSVRVSSREAVADDEWHFLVAAWNGREMSLYIDGALTASGAYDGVYTTAPNTTFRIGYADYGVGSVKMDVDEAAFFNRTLSSSEVLQNAFFDATISSVQATQWAKANDSVAHGENAKAETLLSALLRTGQSTGVQGDAALALRLQLGDVLAREGHNAQASAQYVRVLGSPASRFNRSAEEKLSDLLQQSGETSMPRRNYEVLLKRASLEPETKLALRLNFGHALVAANDLAGARAEYSRIANAANASAAWKSLAQMCVARTFVRARQWTAAKAAYQNAKIAGLPPYRAIEINERLQEIARLQAGLPARDPLAGRVHLPTLPVPGLTLWVAPNGSHAGLGTREKPFATLEDARDAIRALRKKSFPKGGVTVQIRGGTYRVATTFALETQDGGSPQSPIVYCAAPNEKPLFEAGANLKDFRRARDASVLARLPEAARGKVLQADLKAQNISDFGVFELGGFGSARGFATHPILELFFNGRAMPLAGWPNTGYTRIADAAPNAKDSFTYEGDRPERWTREPDAWLYGYWFFDWADSYEKIAAIDTDKKTITLTPPVTTYGDGTRSFLPNHRFRVVNALCELDAPGEWYLDRQSGLLYFYAPSDPTRASVQVSMLAAPVVDMDNVSHVVFQGLTWENGRGDGVIVRDGIACVFKGCTIQQFGGNAVEIQGGTHHGLLGCDLAMLGRGGVVMFGGDRKTLASGHHFIENCHVHHFSRIDHTYTPAVLLNGVGGHVAHNLFHDGFSSALRVEGNDHIIEYNEVRDVLKESDDQGASDMWGNPTYRGVVFRYNFWHDMGNGQGLGQAGIRLDDWISGVEIYGNVFARCSSGAFGAVQINQGTENVIENNLFFECKTVLSGGSGDETGWQRALAGAQTRGYLAEVNALQPPYTTRYPELLHLGDVRTTDVWRNVAIDCGEFLRDANRKNLLDNSFGAANPGFINPKNNDFSLNANSPLQNRLSFQPIPFSEIGLYRDKFRTK